jgi:hypothetical protein
MLDGTDPPAVFLRAMKDLYQALRVIDDPDVYLIGDRAAKTWVAACIEQGFESISSYINDFSGFSTADVIVNQKLNKIFGDDRFSGAMRAAYDFGKYCADTNKNLGYYLECIWPEIEKIPASTESDDSTVAKIHDHGKEIVNPMSISEIENSDLVNLPNFYKN